jgi:acylphosphatase
MSTDPHICRRVIYRGRVQGVGFRYTVASLARRRPVKGYVRNLRDGSVELVVVATEKAFQEFQQEIQQAFLGYIAEATIEEFEPGEDFEGFSLRM